MSLEIRILMPTTAVIAYAMIGTGILLGIFVIIQSIRYRRRDKASKLPLDD
jgi:hypothetical protein